MARAECEAVVIALVAQVDEEMKPLVKKIELEVARAEVALWREEARRLDPTEPQEGLAAITIEEVLRRARTFLSASMVYAKLAEQMKVVEEHQAAIMKPVVEALTPAIVFHFRGIGTAAAICGVPEGTVVSLWTLVTCPACLSDR